MIGINNLIDKAKDTGEMAGKFRAVVLLKEEALKTKNKNVLSFASKCRRILLKEVDSSLEIPECPECREPMQPVYENNGFTEPDGPSKLEITGEKCINCGYEE
jgi:hypothetical protein